MKKTLFICVLILCMFLCSCSDLSKYVDILDKWQTPKDFTVNLYKEDGTKIDLDRLNYKLTDDNVVWEPACMPVSYFSITNNTDQDFTYTMLLDIMEVKNHLPEVVDYALIPDAKLGDITRDSLKTINLSPLKDGINDIGVSDVVLAPNSTNYYAIVFFMDETAGNEYQHGDFSPVLNVTVNKQ